jgi:hypothetical protein
VRLCDGVPTNDGWRDFERGLRARHWHAVQCGQCRAPASPQFNTETLPGQMAGVNIDSTNAPGLGGCRRPAPDSPNNDWRTLSFRGYADYMQTADFAESLVSMIELAQRGQVALMRAESATSAGADAFRPRVGSADQLSNR